MTTTAFDDQFTPATQTIEPVRHPYDTVAILRRNVADLEVALKQQTERAEAAEGELESVREDNHSMMLEIHNLRIELEQKPVAWMDAEGDTYKEEPPENWCPPHVPLYAAPVPAAPYGVDDEAANRIALAVYDWKKGINPEPLLYAINRILATEAHPLSDEGQRALLQSAEVRHD